MPTRRLLSTGSEMGRRTGKRGASMYPVRALRWQRHAMPKRCSLSHRSGSALMQINTAVVKGNELGNLTWLAPLA
jgi:hypothetical protein